MNSMCLNDYANKIQPWAWLALRVVAGIMFTMHGAQKLFGFMGKTAQPFLGGMDFFGLSVGVNMLWVAGFIEFFGGLLLIVGLCTRWAALWSAILMVMAYLKAHLGVNPLATGGELAVMYFLVWVAVFAYGAGPYSLDEKWCKKSSGTATMSAAKPAKKK